MEAQRAARRGRAARLVLCVGLASVAGVVLSAVWEARRYHRTGGWLAFVVVVGGLAVVAVLVLWARLRRNGDAESGRRPRSRLVVALGAGGTFVAAVCLTTLGLALARGTVLSACGWASPGELVALNHVRLGTLADGLEVQRASCDESQPGSWQRLALPRSGRAVASSDVIRRAELIGWRRRTTTREDAGFDTCLTTSDPRLQRVSMEVLSGRTRRVESVVLFLDDDGDLPDC